MTAHELLTILSRLPHDAIITVLYNNEYIEPNSTSVIMSTDLYEQRDHIILECK